MKFPVEDHLGLSFSGSFRDFHASQALAYRYEGRPQFRDESLVREDKQIDPSRAEKWLTQEHRSRIVTRFAKCPELLEAVRAYGYEADDQWFADVAGS